MGFRCERCSHEWVPRDSESDPKTCPKCKSPYWDRPRKVTPMMEYEDFKKKIEQTLKAAPGGSLTWTEIRTVAKLPQAFPNNQWVHRMEKDIRLRRQKDAHGIQRWSLA
jgi:hypothetical protein